jgi:hypothetical protein
MKRLRAGDESAPRGQESTRFLPLTRTHQPPVRTAPLAAKKTHAAAAGRQVVTLTYTSLDGVHDATREPRQLPLAAGMTHRLRGARPAGTYVVMTIRPT